MKAPSILLFAILLASCASKKRIANPGDYTAFLRQGVLKSKLTTTAAELSFWETRLKDHGTNYVDILQAASAHLRLFALTGKVDHLVLGDSLLKFGSGMLRNSDPEILFALSQNAITQHRFIDAAEYNKAAFGAEGDRYINRLLEFDAGMELGNYKMATHSLGLLEDKKAFDYLIRRAKLEDHNGNLDKAIELMQQAFEKVKSRSKNLYCWTLSNLADMYGHAGRVKESYEAYIKVLQKDTSYIYALKGIAWIAYSHDKNSAEAKKILHYILSQTNMPDIYLALAEIEGWEGNNGEKTGYIRRFLDEVQKPGYGDMYNKYLISVFTEELADPAKALEIAGKEIKHRATPETYDWLAWAYFKNGENNKAMTLATNYVYKKTFEPNALFHTALVFAANGKKQEAKALLRECLESSFELGPVTTMIIKEKLALL